MTSPPRPFNRAFSDDEIRQIRRLGDTGEVSRVALAKMYGVGKATIDRILRRETYYSVTDVDGEAIAANVRSARLQPHVAPSAAHADELMAKLMAAGLVQQIDEPRADVPPPPNPMETGDLPE